MGALKNAARRYARHPLWLLDYARGTLEMRRPLEPSGLDRAVSEEEAARLVFGVTDYQARVDKHWFPPPEANDWETRWALLELLALAVEDVQPAYIVETGVDRGYSAATMLAASDERTQVHSIDLPPLSEDAGSYTGRAIPERLRSRWHLHIGPSRFVLPRVLRDLSGVDIAVLDAMHTYEAQRDELHAVWPKLTAGGVLFMDDLGSDAFLDFAREVDVEPVIVHRGEGNMPLGVLRKTGAMTSGRRPSGIASARPPR